MVLKHRQHVAGRSQELLDVALRLEQERRELLGGVQMFFVPFGMNTLGKSLSVVLATLDEMVGYARR